jgi:predicted adenine nucleotide alpha hydrolase (AANH) superfamily ATPase
LQGEGARVFGLFYNPNIHPYQEFRRRLQAVEQLAQILGLEMIYRDEYDVVNFLRQVAFRESHRCPICYNLRLDAAAQLAKKSRMDGFTSTLLYSKKQDHELISQLGKEIGRRRGIPFIYRDFRQGWKEGIEKSKEMKLYRQEYCGCIYSEEERYLGIRRQKKPSA